MKRIAAAIVAIAAIAIQVQAADIIVDAGNIKVPSIAVADVQEWLVTEVKTVTVISEVEMVDPDDGHLYTNIVRTVEVVTENPQQKLRRLYRAAGDEAIRAGLKRFRQAKAQAAADAALAAMPDPVGDE